MRIPGRGPGLGLGRPVGLVEDEAGDGEEVDIRAGEKPWDAGWQLMVDKGEAGASRTIALRGRRLVTRGQELQSKTVQKWVR